MDQIQGLHAPSGKPRKLLECYILNPTGTFSNSEDPDEMPHKAAFHQGLHCLLK